MRKKPLEFIVESANGIGRGNSRDASSGGVAIALDLQPEAGAMLLDVACPAAAALAQYPPRACQQLLSPFRAESPVTVKPDAKVGGRRIAAGLVAIHR